MVDEIIAGQNKRLSEHSRVLLRELEKMAVSASRIIPELYANLKDDGFDPWECRAIIEKTIDISQRTIRRLLPAEAKQMEKLPSTRTMLVSNADKMATSVEKPVIEIATQPVPEPEPEPQPPRTTKVLEVTLSKKEFETDIRMFLLNTQQQSLRLHIDLESRTVVKID